MTTPRLRDALRRGLLRPLGFGVGAAAVLCVALPSLSAGGDPAPQDPTSTDVVATVDAENAAVVRAARLLERHDCWTGDAPADMVGVLPGHVVLTVDTAGELHTSYGGERQVGRALDHLFATPDPGVVRVHGFCR